MRPGRELLLALLVLLSAGPAFSQDRNAFPFVDLGKAQALIDTLTKENETLTADAGRLRQQIDTLKAQILASKQGTDGLTPLLDEVRARSFDLAAIAEGLIDRTLKAKAVAAAEKSENLEKRLNQKIAALGLETTGWGRQVETLTDQVSIDEARLIRNSEDIIVLQAAVAKTQAQQARLDGVIGQIDALSGKVDAALQ
jgi:chromosome segregation ATPase